MRPIISQHVAVLVHIDLPECELIVSHFPILRNSSPVRVVVPLIEFARGGQTEDRTWCLEVPHLPRPALRDYFDADYIPEDRAFLKRPEGRGEGFSM
jgi:hypothetical protein